METKGMGSGKKNKKMEEQHHKEWVSSDLFFFFCNSTHSGIIWEFRLYMEVNSRVPKLYSSAAWLLLFIFPSLLLSSPLPFAFREKRYAYKFNKWKYQSAHATYTRLCFYFYFYFILCLSFLSVWGNNSQCLCINQDLFAAYSTTQKNCTSPSCSRLMALNGGEKYASVELRKWKNIFLGNLETFILIEFVTFVNKRKRISFEGLNLFLQRNKKGQLLEIL